MGFKILPGLFSNNFTINANTGEMHSTEPLDREALEDERGQMVVTVMVYDHGEPPLNTTVNVTITVGVSPGHRQGCAGARWGLEQAWMGRAGMWNPWLGQRCRLQVFCGGRVSSSCREAGEGLCSSCLWAGRCPHSCPQPAVGNPVSWKGYSHGLCLLQDLNDNIPVFLNQSYEFSVFENPPGRSCMGRFVGPAVALSQCPLPTECLSPPAGLSIFVGDVNATDADRTEINSRISFRLERGSGSSNFLIRSSRLGPGNYSGQLSLDPDMSLDYDTLEQKFFTLTVLAENTAADNAGDKANVSVMVHVLDVNDESPSILPGSLQDVSVAENGTQQGLIHTLNASDPDTNHSLVFEELAVACFKGDSSAEGVCWDWFVLAPNGSVLVNSSDIDYELCDRVLLTLRVEDLYTERGSRYSQNGTAPTARPWQRPWAGQGPAPALPPPAGSWRQQGGSCVLWPRREGGPSSFELSLLGGQGSTGWCCRAAVLVIRALLLGHLQKP